MPKLVGAPGVKGGKLDVQFAKSVADGMRLLNSDGAFVMAGSNGALVVYTDDDGQYRCVFERHLEMLSEVTVGSKLKVQEWLRQWREQLK